MAYKHKFVIGEEYAFYNNSDELEDNPNFASWEVDLVHSDSGAVAAPNFMTVIKDIISGSDYRWYTPTFTFPNVLPGCYKIIITDTITTDNIFTSNIIEAVSTSDNLMKVKFRNAVNILNYNYVGLPSFENITHVEMFNRHPQTPETAEGYPLINGTFKRVRTILGKTYEFITGWFDEVEHDATHEMIIHSSLKIQIDSVFTDMTKPDDSEYSVEWQEQYEFKEVSFRLSQDNKASSNKAL